MSMSPGVTIRPVASTAFNALAGAMFAATDAIRPSLMATSRIASSLFCGSTTRPPLIRKSYSGVFWAATTAARAAAKAKADRDVLMHAPRCVGGCLWQPRGLPRLEDPFTVPFDIHDREA